ncbi:MAG: hypothetical protein E7386_03450 [Ruminococcaceae bacterium]|nr:hypothetical protein [Oscillospiraceae bacterium]
MITDNSIKEIELNDLDEISGGKFTTTMINANTTINMLRIYRGMTDPDELFNFFCRKLYPNFDKIMPDETVDFIRFICNGGKMSQWPTA